MADPVKNFAKGTLAAGINAADTTVTLQSGDTAKFPSPSADGAFNAVIWNFSDYADPSDDPNREIVRVTANSGNTFTITRAQESTTASTHNIVSKTYRMILAITQKMITDLGAIGTPVENEQLSGSGTSWTLANTPIAGSVKLYAGSARIFPGVGNDYTISGTSITTIASYPAGALWADYRK